MGSVAQILAQDGVMNGQVAEPGTGAIISETNTTSESMVYDTDVTPFNSVWLIPLIIIPMIVYLLWPKENNDEFKSASFGSYAGTKGGRARRESKDYLPENNRF